MASLQLGCVCFQSLETKWGGRHNVTENGGLEFLQTLGLEMTETSGRHVQGNRFVEESTLGKSMVYQEDPKMGALREN